MLQPTSSSHRAPAAHDRHHRSCLSPGHHRGRQGRLRGQGRRFAHRKGRSGDRFRADRPELCRSRYGGDAAGLLPRASLSGGIGIRRRGVVRVESRSDQSSADRSRSLRGGDHSRRRTSLRTMRRFRSISSPRPAAGSIPTSARHPPDLQIARVARQRGISEDQVRAIVDRYTSGRTLGILGEPRVNVLKVNIALDEHYPMP